MWDYASTLSTQPLGGSAGVTRVSFCLCLRLESEAESESESEPVGQSQSEYQSVSVLLSLSLNLVRHVQLPQRQDMNVWRCEFN